MSAACESDSASFALSSSEGDSVDSQKRKQISFCNFELLA